MKRIIQIGLLGFILNTGLSVEAATNPVYIEHARQLADEMKVPFDEQKSLLPQMLELRDAQRDRVFELSRMTSPHSASCKRARRQLMEVNNLIRKLRVTANG